MPGDGLAAALDEIRKRFFANPVEVFPEVELSDLLDGAIVGLLSPVFEELPDCAVLAAGGYGRRTLHPASDLDLLILFRSAVEAETVRMLLDRLGQPGSFEVGYQAKSLDEFRSFDESQIEGYTAFFETRRLCGDSRLADEFTKQTLPTFVDSHRGDFLASLIKARAARRQDGHGIDAAEPNLKFGPGGLRDYHHIRWLSWMMATEPSMSATRAAVLLHRIRNFLHYLSGRNENVLRYQYQAEIAARLGFPDSRARMMSAFRTSTAQILRSLTELETKASRWQAGKKNPTSDS